MSNEYRTLLGEGEVELIEKKSRFIARCAPCEGEAAALAFISAVKSAHKTATHNVWAYSVRENNLARYTDDGEPQGTSGLPVLAVLSGGGMVDAAIVVTRYFGGTLLGKGGLVRAYSSAAAAAVSAARTAIMTPCATLMLECPYACFERIDKLLKKHGAAVISDFAASVTVSATVRESSRAALEAELRELTAARIEAVEISRGFEKIPE